LRWEWLLVGLIVIVTLLNARLSPFFLNTNNLLRTTSDFMEIGILMLPMVFIIITGNIDLSVASILGLAASLMGWLFMNGWNIWLAVVVALLVSVLAGLVNGLLIARLRLPSLVVTIGTLPCTAAWRMPCWATKPRVGTQHPLPISARARCQELVFQSRSLSSPCSQ
jgi:ribose/xylose/arabinose/galactoside ABC-type transport system permease subunit